jgi:molybdate transport system substrate-binding protein
MKDVIKLLGVALLLFFVVAGIARAQVPAQPADPNQPVPAAPLQPPVPVAPAQPAAPPASASPPGAPVPTGPSISIMADGSLKGVLQELAQTWADSQTTGPQMPITLTNAGTMRAKMETGGAWDLIIDADVADTKALTNHGLLVAEGQRLLARNSLVVYGRAPLVKDDELDWYDLIGAEWKKVALGNPDLSTSGRVALHALQKHDLLDDDHKSLYVHAPNEAGALQLIQRQQADAAFVYKTDLVGLNDTNFQAFPIKSDEAPPIFYTGAIFRLAKSADLARQFLDYCNSEAARPIWTKYGFETD